MLVGQPNMEQRRCGLSEQVARLIAATRHAYGAKLPRFVVAVPVTGPRAQLYKTEAYSYRMRPINTAHHGSHTAPAVSIAGRGLVAQATYNPVQVDGNTI